jgi:molybdopterin-biosynthesis enzyme MoeA-like protein
VRAALLLIGNELLSGKITEGNLRPLSETLRKRGVVLARAVTVLDDVATIQAEVNALRTSHDYLFTSGGIGPTHDDVTMDAVAAAFGMGVTQHPWLAAMIRGRYGERCTDAHLRMALIPERAQLETGTQVWPDAAHAGPDEEGLRAAARERVWPAVRLENTWILPGVPEAFRMKLDIVAAFLARQPGLQALVTRSVYTHADEPMLVSILNQIVAEHPDVEVGSYPKWFDDTYKTKVTFDGRDAERVAAAASAFRAALPEGQFVREGER